jgi:hypothetical protein
MFREMVIPGHCFPLRAIRPFRGENQVIAAITLIVCS